MEVASASAANIYGSHPASTDPTLGELPRKSWYLVSLVNIRLPWKLFVVRRSNSLHSLTKAFSMKASMVGFRESHLQLPRKSVEAKLYLHGRKLATSVKQCRSLAASCPLSAVVWKTVQRSTLSIDSFR